MELKRELGLFSAVLIIIADVIGTGIFMTTGGVLDMTGSALVVLSLWAVGGLVAITGSLSYAELSSIWPENGGEYVYLKKIYGFLPSFLTGWISLVVGFSVSAAISSITAVDYFNKFFPTHFLATDFGHKSAAALIVVLFGTFHMIGVKKGTFIQNALTILKLLMVFAFLIMGFYMADWNSVSRLTETQKETGSFFQYGTALIIIMYAYSGWNGATYIAGEIKDPRKNLPRALFLGTLLVTLIYLAINVVFLISTPGCDLAKESAVGALCATNLFGKNIAPVFTASIALILLSSVSVQMLIGPRVYHAMARERMIFHSLEKVHPTFGTPALAIFIQMVLTVVYIFIGKENIFQLLIYLGFSLGVFPLMSVIGLVIYRYKNKTIEHGFRTPLFPLIPGIYILLSSGMMITSLVTNTKTSLTALAVLVLGTVIFFIWQKIVKGKN